MNIRINTDLLLRASLAFALVTTLGSISQAELVHQYTFNDGNGADSVGTADATLIGTANVGFDGRLNLLGGDVGASYAELPGGIASAASVGGSSGQITTEAWVKINANSDWAVIFSFGNSGPDPADNDGNDGDYWQLIPQSGPGVFRSTTHLGDPGGETAADDSGPLATGSLHHVVNVLNVGANTNELYLNGTLVGSSEIHAGFDPNTYGTVGDTQNWLGRSQWGDPSLDGSYEEFRVYDHALSGAEVTESFEAGPVLPTLVTLVVNTITGQSQLRNDASLSLDLGYYEINSAGGALNPADGAWNSLSDQNIDPVDGPDPDSIAGSQADETWEEIGGASSTVLGEFFVQSETTLAPGATLDLGSLFDSSVFGSGVDGDLEFFFADGVNSGYNTEVVYVTSAGIDGDFDSDGDVDGADFLNWQRNVGSLGAAGLGQWESNYGTGVGTATSVVAAVPEPATAFLLAIPALFGLFLQRRRRVFTVAVAPAVVFTLCGFVATTGYAAVHVDRDYTLGDDGAEGASASSTVSTTFDSAGIGGTGNFQDLNATSGNPSYVNVSSRPFAGGSTLGVAFDGNDALLRFNDDTPEQIFNRGGLGNPNNNLPQNPYDNFQQIFTRGIQAWVNPTNSGSGTRQDVANDTYQFGLHITDTDTWGMTYGSNGVDSRVIDTSEAVSFNTWAHVAQHTTGDHAVLYVNGIAVQVYAGFYQEHAAGADLGFSVGSSLDGTTDFFTGTIDDVQVYVAGDNTGVAPLADRGDLSPIPQPGMDYGTANFGTDNEYAQGILAGKPQGDLNLDGSVNSADASTFIANWLTTPKELNGFAVGDLDTYALGDLDFDGEIDIDDAFLMHEGLQLAGLGGLNFSLLNGSPVPEPGSFCLLLTGLAAAALCRKRV